MPRKPVSFSITAVERKRIDAIADRAAKLWKLSPQRRLNVAMSVTACHCNGCPLDLKKLAAADAFNFQHDVAGIDATISRRTGKIRGHFWPRCAARQAA